MSKGPPPGRCPGWSRMAAPWEPAGGPTAPSPSPWEVTVRPRSRRLRRPRRVERRARGSAWRAGRHRAWRGRQVRVAAGRLLSAFPGRHLAARHRCGDGDPREDLERACGVQPSGVRRPSAERGHPGPGSGRAAVRGAGLILPEGNGLRACPALGASLVRIALGQLAGIPLPAGGPAGRGRAWAVPAGEGIACGLGAGGRAAFAFAGDTS